MSDDLVKPTQPPQRPFYIDEDGDIVDADGWLVCCPARDVWDNDEAHALWVLRCLKDADRIEELEEKLERAVEALKVVVCAKGLTDPTEYGYEAITSARTTIEELTGGQEKTPPAETDGAS